jgi:hypothetical protein
VVVFYKQEEDTRRAVGIRVLSASEADRITTRM